MSFHTLESSEKKAIEQAGSQTFWSGALLLQRLQAKRYVKSRIALRHSSTKRSYKLLLSPGYGVRHEFKHNRMASGKYLASLMGPSNSQGNASPYGEHMKILGNNQAHYIDVVNRKDTSAAQEIQLYDHDMNNGTY